MRRAVGILSTAIVPVFIATMAFAADPYGSERGSTHGQGATSGTSGYMGEHSMTGKITDIDKDKGHVKVEAQGEKLELHFPQSALRNLNEGDQVTIMLGIKPATGTSGTRGSGSGTSGSGMPGSRGSEPSGEMPGSHGGAPSGGGTR
jgi:hypothetical protein